MRKTKSIILGTAIIAALAMTACGGSDDKKTEAKKTETTTAAAANTANNAADVANAIKNGGEFKDSLEELDSDMALSKIYELEDVSVDDSFFYTNTNSTAEEIAVVRLKDDADADKVKAAFQQRVADQKEACEDYLPDEITKLDNALITKSGNYMILVISCDSDKANAAINSVLN